MRTTTVLAALGAASIASAAPPFPPKPFPPGGSGNLTKNPFEGKKLFANPEWAAKLEQTYESFVAQGDSVNAANVRKVQKQGTFVWVSNIASLSNIDAAIAAARQEQLKTRKKQIVGLVLYNLPDRDCSAGESAGELKSSEGGLQRYKEEYVNVYAQKVASAPDLEFAIVLEPDSLANLVTNMGIEACANAAPVYEEGIAYAIQRLQVPNVHLYIDASHGGWLGWADNLPLGKTSSSPL